MASLNVLYSPELVEVILLNLDILDLLRAKSVCTLWLDTINRRDDFKTLLFLKPITDCWWLQVRKPRQFLNPQSILVPTLVPPAGDACYRDGRIPYKQEPRAAHKYYGERTVGRLHPLLHVRPSDQYPLNVDQWDSWDTLAVLPQATKLLQWERGSLANMLICQPPCNVIGIYSSRRESKVQLYNSTGITFDDLATYLASGHWWNHDDMASNSEAEVLEVELDTWISDTHPAVQAASQRQKLEDVVPGRTLYRV